MDLGDEVKGRRRRLVGEELFKYAQVASVESEITT